VLYRLRRRDGRYRWAIDAGQPRFSASGKYEGIVGTVIDIHERQLAEQGLQRLTRQLSAANQRLTRTNTDLDNFIYTASHDLKAPITNIEGLLDALQFQLPAQVQQTYEVVPLLAMMHDSIIRFQRTLDYLSDVTKLQLEYDQLPTTVPLAPLVEDVCLDLQPFIQQMQAQVEVDLTACSSIAFSPKNLRSVVYNLLSNALKYRHPDRTPLVRIRCRQEPEYTVLLVEDNGLGLEADQQAKLFTMFRRFHNHVEGSGLGLYMVKRSVENAGGRVEVQSELHIGSTFSVFFPC
jgi:signal transduction histidine kinase